MAVGNYDLMHWESVDQGNQGDISWLRSQTKKTGVDLVQSMSFTTGARSFSRQMLASDVAPGIELSGTLAPGSTVTFEKLVVAYTSRDGVDPYQAALQHHTQLLAVLPEVQERDIHNARSISAAAEASKAYTPVYDILFAPHQEAWRQFWETADIVIEGDDKAQLGIRYNIYQLRINASPHDDRYSVAAKGLTGFGYRGHIFHDTEIFMLPFYTNVLPHIARNLLIYRYRTLPEARKKAASNGYEGAQYAWESTLSGKETTPISIVHPETGEVIPVLNGSLELHITSSIAHAVWQYWRVTQDDEFMRNYGAEIMLSTATFWGSRVEKNDERNDYEITNVIGPDEWHEHVNNNAFTNYMVRENLKTAIATLEWLRQTNVARARELEQQLNLTPQRLAHWDDVIAHIRIPQDPQTGLFEQFDNYFQLPPLDQSRYEGRTDSYQGILGIEEVQKYSTIKQADVLMLLTVMDDAFDLKTKRTNWDCYYPLTDHDYGSSLTPSFHVLLACELGQANAAYALFMKGALVDLENLRGNTPEGIHAACSGSVWQAAVLGFGGLRITEDSHTTESHLPDHWTRLAFTVIHKGQPIHVDLRK
jgi:kojibiose phosphorylase